MASSSIAFTNETSQSMVMVWTSFTDWNRNSERVLVIEGVKVETVLEVELFGFFSLLDSWAPMIRLNSNSYWHKFAFIYGICVENEIMLPAVASSIFAFPRDRILPAQVAELGGSNGYGDSAWLLFIVTMETEIVRPAIVPCVRSFANTMSAIAIFSWSRWKITIRRLRIWSKPYDSIATLVIIRKFQVLAPPPINLWISNPVCHLDIRIYIYPSNICKKC